MPMASYGVIRQKESWTLVASKGLIIEFQKKSLNPLKVQTENLCQIYVALHWPKLDCGCQAYSPGSKSI